MKNKRNICKQVFHWMLSLAMCLTLLPVTTFAATIQTSPNVYEADKLVGGSGIVGSYLIVNLEDWVDINPGDNDFWLDQYFDKNDDTCAWVYIPKGSNEEIVITEGEFDEFGYSELKVQSKWLGGTIKARFTFDDAVLYSTPITVSIEAGHGPASTYVYDDDYHYYPCIASGCTNEDHKFNYEYHDFILKSNEEGHWQECTVCPYSQEEYVVEHWDGDSDGICDVCHADYTMVGKCGPNAKWIYNGKEKTLTISGNGELYSPVSTSGSTMYNSLDWDTCTIEEGITNIPDYFFSYPGIAPIKTIYIADSVSVIGTNAFTYTKVENVIFGEHSKLEEIKDGAFDSVSIEEIYLPNGLKTIGTQAFMDSKLKKVHIPYSVESIAPWAFAGTSLEEVYFNGDRSEWNKLTDSLEETDELLSAKLIFTNLITLKDLNITLDDTPIIGATPSNDGYVSGYAGNYYNKIEDYNIEWMVGSDGTFTTEPTYATIKITLMDGFTMDDSTDISFDDMDEDYGYKLSTNDAGQVVIELRTKAIIPVAYDFKIATVDGFMLEDGAKYVVGTDGYGFSTLVKLNSATNNYITFDSTNAVINVVGKVKLYGPYNGITVYGGNVTITGNEGSELIIDGIGNAPISISTGSSVILDGAVDLNVKSSANSAIYYNGSPTNTALLSTKTYSGDVSIEQTNNNCAAYLDKVDLETTGNVTFKTADVENSAPVISCNSSVSIKANSIYLNNYIIAFECYLKAKEDITIDTDRNFTIHSLVMEGNNIKINSSSMIFNIYPTDEPGSVLLNATNNIDIAANGGNEPVVAGTASFTAKCKNFKFDVFNMYNAFQLGENAVDINATDTITFNYNINSYLFSVKSTTLTAKTITLNEIEKHIRFYIPVYEMNINGDFIYNADHEYKPAGMYVHQCEICDEYGEHDFSAYESNGDGTHRVVCKDCGKVQDGHDKDACSGGNATCTSKAKCVICGNEYGDLKKHDFSNYVSNGDGTHKVVCKDCGYMQEGHEHDTCSGGVATCTSKAKCTLCGKEYGTIKEHTYVTNIEKATIDKDGKVETKCEICGHVSNTTAISMPKTFTLAKTSYAYTGSQIKPAITVKDSNGNVIDATNYTVSYGTNKAAGKGTVKVTFTGNYVGTKTVEFSINPKKTTIGTPVIAADGITVKWTKNTTGSGYYIYRSINGAAYKKVKTITSNATVSWKDTGAKTNGAKYQYKIIAYKTVSGTTYKSVYSSVKTMYFVSKPKIASLTNSASKKMTVKWAKNGKATGYQIQYALKSNFSSAKSVTVTKNATVSKVIGSLTKGKTYYVRMRSYKTVSGTKYYSVWSDKKSVKITK